MNTRRITAALFALGLVSAAADVSAQTEDMGAETAGSNRPDSNESALLASGKIGGIMPLNGMKPFLTGGVELGWIFAGTNQRMAALLDVTYTVPTADGKEQDDRLAYDEVTGNYSWSITQKELVLQPTFLYRLTSDSELVPFVGLGPRIYFLETVGEGKANGEVILDTSEKSTKFGVGLPLGAEYTLGPGGLFAELLFEWGPLDHRITGDTSLLAANLFLGYRGRF